MGPFSEPMLLTQTHFHTNQWKSTINQTLSQWNITSIKNLNQCTPSECRISTCTRTPLPTWTWRNSRTSSNRNTDMNSSNKCTKKLDRMLRILWQWLQMMINSKSVNHIVEGRGLLLKLISIKWINLYIHWKNRNLKIFMVVKIIMN